MKSYMVMAAAVLAVCLASGTVYAAYDQAFGEVKSIDVDGGKLVVAVRAGRDAEPKEVTYKVDKDTTVRINREKKTLADLTAGKRVTVVFKEAENEGDAPLALLISVMERRPGGAGGAGGGRTGKNRPGGAQQ